MKKILLGLAAVLLILSLTGCPNMSTLLQKKETLTTTLNKGGDVNLQNKKFLENAAISKAGITVSNANLGGYTLTVYAQGVTLKNIKNANLVIAESVGDGDVFIDGCEFKTVKVQGGGANSIHFKKTVIQHVTVEKEAVRVVLEEGTDIQKATVSADNAKIEAAPVEEPSEEGSGGNTETSPKTAFIKELQIAENTTGIKIQKVEAEAVVINANVKSVVVEDVKTEDLSIKENAQDTTIKGTEVKKTITIEKEVEKVKIEECAITTAQVSNDAGSVEVSGGTVEKLQVVKTKTTQEIKTVVTITKSETVIADAEVVAKNGQLVAEEKASVAVAEEIKDIIELPKTIEKVTVTNVSVDVSKVDTEYKTGDAFIASGIYISLTYSNNTTGSVPVNPETVTVEGFDSSLPTEESQKVKITVSYEGKDYSAEINVSISARPDYVGQGITQILAGNYDAGVEKFYKAYEEQKTDETKMFYCLAELASLSTDESVATLLKENFAFKEYPATMNALLSGDWMKEYPNTKRVDIYTMTEKENGWLIRCDIDQSVETYEYPISYLIDEDGDWVEAQTVDFDDETESTTYTTISITGVAKPSETGRYMISSYNFTNPERTSDGEKVWIQMPEGTPRYDNTILEKKYVIDEKRSVTLPDFVKQPWFSNSKTYTETVIHGVETVDSISRSLIAGILDCNPDGANELVDNCLKIFNNKKINNVKTIANTIKEPIALPEQIIEAFNLGEILGEKDVTIGKAELNILISLMDILKGTFQYLSSYDLSANVELVKDFFKDDKSITADVSEKIITGKTLEIRSKSAMSNAQSTFVSALNTFIGSYKSIFPNKELFETLFPDETFADDIDESCVYPEFVQQMVAYYAKDFLPGIISLRDAIKGGKVFYLPEGNGMPSWEKAPDPKTARGIDMGKLFTPGYFTGIIEKDANGNAPLYTQAQIFFSRSSQEKVEEIDPYIEAEVSDSGRYEYYYKMTTEPVSYSSFDAEAVKNAVKESFIASKGYNSCYLTITTGYLFHRGKVAALLVNCKDLDSSDVVLEMLDNQDLSLHKEDNGELDGDWRTSY